MLEIEELKTHLPTGVDAKIMQYEENATNISDDRIDFPKLLDGTQTTILINMERHTERYHVSLDQLKKLSIQNFVHLKGTDGKIKSQLEQDLTYILEFIKQFNDNVVANEIQINDFSEVNNKGVNLQDGPLGCYCSHLRAMIYGYLSGSDYTVICEDDISITNTKNIEEYIPQIPNDWDIIFLNSRPKNVLHDEPFYRFIDEFHSGHFYIVKNKSLPTIFSGMYPMNDQVDVLLSFLHKKLNMYNIPDTVYQKNLETNTQNNLDIIFSSPNYKPVTDALFKIENSLNIFANKTLTNNVERNRFLVKQLMYDVLYNFILTKGNNNEPGPNKEDYTFENPYINDENYLWLEKFITFFLQCAKKGIEPKSAAKSLSNVLLYTICKFSEYHNKNNNEGKIYKAHGFGSTSHTYMVGRDLILKKYNPKLRWTIKGHDNSEEILKKEIKILSLTSNIPSVPKVLNRTETGILMEYRGQSLYDRFKLPRNWVEQITKIFEDLTKQNIYYPEFRLQNILVKNKEISFVDFGLAEIRGNCDNSENLEKFIKYLSLLEEKFTTIKDLDERQRLISTFLKNVL